MSWNDGAVPRTCHCSTCDAPPEPACTNCKADCAEIDERGLCAMCRPIDEETCEDWENRVAKRRPQ